LPPENIDGVQLKMFSPKIVLMYKVIQASPTITKLNKIELVTQKAFKTSRKRIWGMSKCKQVEAGNKRANTATHDPSSQAKDVTSEAEPMKCGKLAMLRV
jgi:hypothetical protein